MFMYHCNFQLVFCSSIVDFVSKSLPYTLPLLRLHLFLSADRLKKQNQNQFTYKEMLPRYFFYIRVSAAEPKNAAQLFIWCLWRFQMYTTHQSPAPKMKRKRSKIAKYTFEIRIPDGQIIQEIGQHNADNCAHSTRIPTRKKTSTSKRMRKSINNKI